MVFSLRVQLTPISYIKIPKQFINLANSMEEYTLTSQQLLRPHCWHVMLNSMLESVYVFRTQFLGLQFHSEIVKRGSEDHNYPWQWGVSKIFHCLFAIYKVFSSLHFKLYNIENPPDPEHSISRKTRMGTCQIFCNSKYARNCQLFMSKNILWQLQGEMTFLDLALTNGLASPPTKNNEERAINISIFPVAY